MRLGGLSVFVYFQDPGGNAWNMPYAVLFMEL